MFSMCLVRDLSYKLNIYMYVSWSISVIRVRLIPSNMFKPSCNFLTDHSKLVLLLWIIFVICVLCMSLSYCRVCSLQPYGYLLGMGWPFCSLMCDVFLCFWHFSKWCPGSGMVLDCIDFLSMPSLLLWVRKEDFSRINPTRRKLH